MTLIPARERVDRQHFIALCVHSEKRGLHVELAASSGTLTVIRVVRPGAGSRLSPRTAVKLVEATITETEIDGAAQDCLKILDRSKT
jgi:hypothetical protein